MTAIDEREMTADERYIRAGLVDGSLVAVGASAIRPLLDEIDRLRTLRPGSTGETEGWVLVPKEPTPGMRVAGRDALRSLFDSSPCEADAADTYRAMLAAAGGRDE